MKTKRTLDNFEDVKSYFKFSNDNFYIIEIIMRKKDNPDATKKDRSVKKFYVSSFKDILDVKFDIIKLCDTYNARAYLTCNPRNKKAVAYKSVQIAINYIEQGLFNNVQNAYDKAAGKSKINSCKQWLLDLDYCDLETAVNIQNEVEELTQQDSYLFDTLNGFSLVCKPFKRDALSSTFPFDIQSNGSMILYAKIDI